MSPASAFLKLWLTENTRETFLSHVPKDDLASLRLVCHEFGVRATPALFENVKVTFRASTFSKPARMAALERIGHNVRTFHFNMPHTRETFLAPLVSRETGEEIRFAYEPYIPSKRDSASRLSEPTYGSWELTDVLVKQYSPLFHAAANVPSFIRVFAAMKNLKHLKISCPDQEPAERYRRGVVDYALISLRIAVERTKLPLLDTLSLLSVHPCAVFYLNPIMGFGARPNSMKRWKQIEKLTIHMEPVPPEHITLPDHLKFLHAYIRLLAPTVRNFNFRWQREKGPCPVSLDNEPRLVQDSPRLSCPTRYNLPLSSVSFPRLRKMKMQNLIVDASQIAKFVGRHEHFMQYTDHLNYTVDQTHLRTGTWNEAFAPLSKISGSDKWKERPDEWISRYYKCPETPEEFMDVPLILTPEDIQQDELENFVEDCTKMRHSRIVPGRYSVLQRAEAKTKELLNGTEEQVRKLFNSSVFSWR